MSILSSLVNKYLSETITVENAQAAVGRVLTEVAGFVAGTENQIDDAVLAEIELDVNFDSLAEKAVGFVRGFFHLEARPKMFAAGPAHPPKLFLGIVRGRLVSEVMRAKHVGRAEARAIVAKASDDFILARFAESHTVGAIGDGTILNWLIAHGPDLLAFIMKLLPLILAL